MENRLFTYILKQKQNIERVYKKSCIYIFCNKNTKITKKIFKDKQAILYILLSFMVSYVAFQRQGSSTWYQKTSLDCRKGELRPEDIEMWRWYSSQATPTGLVVFATNLLLSLPDDVLKYTVDDHFCVSEVLSKQDLHALHCFSVQVSYESQHLFWSWYFSTMAEKNTMQEIMFCSFLVLSSANACFQPVKKQNWTSSKQILFHFQTFSLEKKPRLRPFEELCQKPTAQKFLLFSMHALIGKKNFSKKVLFTTSGDSP